MKVYMKRIKLYFGYCLIALHSYGGAQEQKPALEIQIGAKETRKVPVVLITVGDEQYLNEVCAVVKKDMEWTDQFIVTNLHMKSMPHKKEIKQFEHDGYALFLFISYNKKKKSYEVLLYDVHKGSMVTSKGYLVKKESKEPRGWAHAIADLIVEVLTNQKGMFSSKLVYCKEITHGKRYVCISDYDGSHEQKIAQAFFLLAPRWNNDEDDPAILYSRQTPSNIRLMHINLGTGKEKAIASYEGLNMLPTFSSTTNEMVVCLSCKGGRHLFSCNYDPSTKMKFTQLTFNDGNNIWPTITEDNNIIFCSDFEDNRPQLYKLDRNKDELTCLSEPWDVCFAPSYCPVNKKVVYTKMVDGIGQLWIYHTKTGKHTQITYDQGHKQEASWSPCGNYIVYCLGNGASKCLVMHNLLTGTKRKITSPSVQCSYPSWSMNFSVFPVFFSSNDRHM